MISFSADQLIVVTGATSGIGKGIALLLNKLGATVLGIGRNIEKLEQLKTEAQYPNHLICEQKDLTNDIEHLPDYIKSLREKYGKLYGLVCSAGITLIQSVQSYKFEQVKNLFDIDYFAPIGLAKGFVDRRNNVGKGANVVFISSLLAKSNPKGMIAYSGAKSALCASAKVMAREVAPYSIRVNCVLPGDIETPMTLANPTVLEAQKSLYPMGIGKVSDVVNIVTFLLSNQAQWITGQDYIVDCASW